MTTQQFPELDPVAIKATRNALHAVVHKRRASNALCLSRVAVLIGWY